MKENRILAFKISALLFIAGGYIGVFLLRRYSTVAFWWTFGIMTVLSLVMVIQLIIAQNNVHKFIARMDLDINSMERETLFKFPAPTVIIDSENTIVWYNQGFCDSILRREGDPFGTDINEVITITEDVYRPEGAMTSCGDRWYKIYATRMNSESDTAPDSAALSMLYFEDVTEFASLEARLKDGRVCVILMVIDNYEDLINNVKESDKAHILVQIEKLLENFSAKTSGIIKKLSSDRFIAILNEKDVDAITEEKFNILDRARAITVGDRTSVTLSIGVGRGGRTIAESEAFAKQALDMSLGRGGDQAAVKTENGYEFFGGVSKGIEKQAKVKTRIIATALMETIANASNVIIMGHRFGDLDSIGSAVGLSGAIRKMGKTVNVVVDPERNLSESLIDRINDTVGKGLFIAPKDVFIPDEDGACLLTEGTLLIVVDTHSPAMVESAEILNKSRQIVVIDHHRKMVDHIENAVIFLHEPYSSSASEMVSELIQYFGDCGKLDSYYAEALLAGITLDTKNFVMRTGVRTFEAAAFLRKLGADTVAVRGLFANSIEAYRSRSQIISSAEVYRRCAIAVSSIACEDIRVSAPQAADELLGISGVDASFVIYESGGTVNFSARSMGVMNVQLVMEKLGGGGHQTMAGAQLEGITAAEAKQRLIAAIDEYISNTTAT